MTLSKPQAIVVTGATGGIGRAMLVRIALNNPNTDIILVGRDEKALERVVNRAMLRKPNISVVDFSSMEKVMSEAADIISKHRINAIYHCAGSLMLDHRLRNAEAAAAYHRVNFEGPKAFITALIPALVQDATIAIVASEMAYLEWGMGGFQEYCLAKRNLREWAQTELLHDRMVMDKAAKVVVFMLGFVRTGLFEKANLYLMKRVAAQMEEPANAAIKMMEAVRAAKRGYTEVPIGRDAEYLSRNVDNISRLALYLGFLTSVAARLFLKSG